MTERRDEVPTDLELRLRAALAREAGAVHPPADGLQRIRERIADRPRRRITAWWPSPRRGLWLPALAAAAAVALLALAIPSLLPGRGDGGAAAPVPAAGPLPVYFVAEQDGRWALVREFEPTTLTDPRDRLDEALRRAVSGRAIDPDDTSVWRRQDITDRSPAGLADLVGAEATATGITVSLDARLTDTTLAGAQVIDPELATLAVDQLVWTATATAQESAPVRIVVTDAAGNTGGPGSMFGQVSLDGPFQRVTGEADPRAEVWVNSLTDGQTVRVGTLTVIGDAARAALPVHWRLRRTDGDGTIATGQGLELSPVSSDATTADAPDAPTPTRVEWRAELTFPGPGSYLFEVTASGGSPGWSATKTVIVR
jgi:hypothetical protein